MRGDIATTMIHSPNILFLDDVEQLCKRLIVINNGGIIEDGPLDSIVERLAPYRVLLVELSRLCLHTF